MRLSLKERRFIFLVTFSLPSSSSLFKVPGDDDSDDDNDDDSDVDG